MMTSLVPGSIFASSGLNRKSTPTPPTVTPSELDQRYSRADFDGEDWPCESPVQRVYDVQNTSTKMIILNNKYGKGVTRLRGYYNGSKSSRQERHIDPERHLRVSSPINAEHHQKCCDSSTPRFEPQIRTDLEWLNRSSDQSLDSDRAKSLVNPKRHTYCQVPHEPLNFRSGMVRPKEQTPQRLVFPQARFWKSSMRNSTIGERLYMWSVQRIYSSENMKRLKQQQYQKLLELEAKKGYTGYQEYAKYMRYINGASSRTYGTGSPSDMRRTKSATPSKADSGRISPAKTDKATDRQKDERRARPHTTTSQIVVQSNSKEKKKTEEQPRGKSQTKSPSTKRNGSAKSNTSSVKSKTASENSRATSTAKQQPTSKKRDHSPSSSSSSSSRSSLSDSREEKKALHKEGEDRPKSRLGHPSPRDRDKGPMEQSGGLKIQFGEDTDEEEPSRETEDKLKTGDKEKSTEAGHTTVKEDPDTVTPPVKTDASKPVHRSDSEKSISSSSASSIENKSNNDTGMDKDKKLTVSETKHDQPDSNDVPRQSDDHQVQKDLEQEPNTSSGFTHKQTIQRQDSLEFDPDDDRRMNRDIETIEY